MEIVTNSGQKEEWNSGEFLNILISYNPPTLVADGSTFK